MIRWNWNSKIGEFTATNKMADGKVIKSKYSVYEGNCLAVIILEYKDNDGKDAYRFDAFINDIAHAKRVIKDYGTLFGKNVSSIKLNLYYKEAIQLAKMITKSGQKVSCYYREPKVK